MSLQAQSCPGVLVESWSADGLHSILETWGGCICTSCGNTVDELSGESEGKQGEKKPSFLLHPFTWAALRRWRSDLGWVFTSQTIWGNPQVRSQQLEFSSILEAVEVTARNSHHSSQRSHLWTLSMILPQEEGNRKESDENRLLPEAKWRSNHLKFLINSLQKENA